MSFVLVTLFCSTIFIAIGIFSIRKKTAVHFWTNQKLERNEISDISSYNREVGRMWLTFGSLLAIASLLHLVLQNIIGPILVALTTVMGVIVMATKYGTIYTKYKK